MPSKPSIVIDDAILHHMMSPLQQEFFTISCTVQYINNGAASLCSFHPDTEQ